MLTSHHSEVDDKGYRAPRPDCLLNYIKAEEFDFKINGRKVRFCAGILDELVDMFW